MQKINVGIRWKQCGEVAFHDTDIDTDTDTDILVRILARMSVSVSVLMLVSWNAAFSVRIEAPKKMACGEGLSLSPLMGGVWERAVTPPQKKLFSALKMVSFCAF